MATFELDDTDAEALRRQAEREHRPVDELAVEAVRELLARRSDQTRSDELDREIERVTSDRGFMEMLDSLVERDREILDRLAE